MENINYYTTGITARGYAEFLQNNLKQISKIIYVKGNVDKNKVAKEILSVCQKDSSDMEYIHSPYGLEEFEAIINNRNKWAVVFKNNNNQSLIIDERVEVINYDEAIDCQTFLSYKILINDLKKQSQNCLNNAYSLLDKALKTHDEWEKIYIENMDFKKADSLALDIIKRLIGEKIIDKKSVRKDRFLGAATPDGAKDFIQNLTSEVNKRYFIKGRPGTGKSTILKKLAKQAEESGFDLEVYHCGFDPNSLDMLIIRELSICIFDSTAPHEHFPNRESDEIIDVYNVAVKKHTDEKFSEKIKEISTIYKLYIKAATLYLKARRGIEQEILEVYEKCVDNTFLVKLNKSILKILE